MAAGAPRQVLALALALLWTLPPSAHAAGDGLPATQPTPHPAVPRRPAPRPVAAHASQRPPSDAAPDARPTALPPGAPGLAPHPTHPATVPAPAPALVPAPGTGPSPNSSTRPAHVPAALPHPPTPSSTPASPAPGPGRSLAPTTPRVAPNAASTASARRGPATAVEGTSCQLGDGSGGVYRPASECQAIRKTTHPALKPRPGLGPARAPRPVPTPTSATRPGPGSTSPPRPGPAPTAPLPPPSPPPLPLVCCPSDTKADRMCRMYIEKVYLKGQPQQRRQRAIGGQKAKLCEFPHMAMIGYGRNINASSWNCGGTLISNRYVLTAGHCLFTKLGEARWVRLGALNAHNDSKTMKFRDYEVAERITAPRFRRQGRYNDIGLLRLRREVAFSDAIKPACLHARRAIAHRQAIATGWGATQPMFYDGSEHLMKVFLDIQKVDVCIKAYSDDQKSASLAKGIEDESMICAGRLEGGYDTCDGDSGGPLQVKLLHTRPCVFSVLGVTSFGKAVCGAPNAPAVYTRVSHFLPWIESVVWPERR